MTPNITTTYVTRLLRSLYRSGTDNQYRAGRGGRGEPDEFSRENFFPGISIDFFLSIECCLGSMLPICCMCVAAEAVCCQYAVCVWGEEGRPGLVKAINEATDEKQIVLISATRKKIDSIFSSERVICYIWYILCTVARVICTVVRVFSTVVCAPVQQARMTFKAISGSDRRPVKILAIWYPVRKGGGGRGGFKPMAYFNLDLSFSKCV